MKTRIAVCIAAGFASLLHAQPLPNPIPTDNQQRQNPTQNQNNSGNTGNTANAQGFWQASLPGGTFVVQVNKITSVSRHRYLLDGALVVDEVTVDTTGQSLARFYFITPVGGTGGTVGDTANAALQQGKGLLDAAGQKAGVDLDNMVIKKYPDTTHARTIEYRIPTETQLTSLFNSAKQAWQTGQGGQFTVQLK